MGDLSKNISRYEVACHCGCGLDTIDAETIIVVQKTADYFAKKRGIERSVVIITSGVRCRRHNKKVSKSVNSLHSKFRAIDFIIKDIPAMIVTAYLDDTYPEKYGIGEYRHFTHIDTKSGKARRWVK